MLARRLENIATLLVLLIVTACTVLPSPRIAPHAPTRRVAIGGEEADTLAETTGESDDALVALRAHDGRELWVREGELLGASLVPGTWVLVRRSGEILSLRVVRSLDDFVEVELAGQPTIVPVADVLARLHHGPVAEAPPPPPAVETPPPPSPPTPIAQIAVIGSAPSTRAGTLDGCTGGLARVVFADGSEVHVPRAQVHPLRVHAGDRVTALWNGSPYPATILATRDSLVRARWEDESEQWIDLTDVQSVEASATGAVNGCPHRAVLVDEGLRMRLGRVLACDTATATVLDPDGAPQTLSRASLSRAPLHVGDAIEARWNGTPYDATVLSIGDRVHVRWYDASEGDVDPADVVSYRAREARPSEPVACPG